MAQKSTNSRPILGLAHPGGRRPTDSPSHSLGTRRVSSRSRVPLALERNGTLRPVRDPPSSSRSPRGLDRAGRNDKAHDAPARIQGSVLSSRPDSRRILAMTRKRSDRGHFGPILPTPRTIPPTPSLRALCGQAPDVRATYPPTAPVRQGTLEDPATD